MNDEFQNAASVGIIGGADGPTCVFVAGKGVKLPLRVRISNRLHRRRRRRAERKITAGTHTLEETAAYAMDIYGAVKASENTEAHTPPSCVYEIRSNGDCLEVEIDYSKETIGVSFSGSKRAMKRFRKIAKDLYAYYGVSENDISKKTERYLSLLGILSM